MAAAAVAGLVLRRRGAATTFSGGAVGLTGAAVHRVRPSEGGSFMVDQQEQNAAEGAAAETVDEPRADSPPGEQASPQASPDIQAPAEAAASAEAEAPADLADVGAAVDSVLKSAQEAAVRIRSQARDEAAKIREEAKAAAAAELAEARRTLDSDRGDVGRLRTEAEADAEATRAEAEAFARQVRANAEREADQLLEEARTRVASADGEIEKRLREVEGDALRRRDTLQAESKLYEERLEKMLGVCEGMSSQLKELLGLRTEDLEGWDDAGARETRETALEPDTASAREG
jgi:hypothetical protein